MMSSIRSTRFIVIVFLIVWDVQERVSGHRLIPLPCLPKRTTKKDINLDELKEKAMSFRRSNSYRHFYALKADNPFAEEYGRKCGEGMFHSSIVSGKVAKPNSWPWQIFLVVDQNRATYACGGTLISNDWMVTAAHCLKHDGQVYVFLGVHDIRYTGPWNKVFIPTPRNVFVHPDYRPGDDFTPDIALIKFPYPISFTPKIQPACLPKAFRDYSPRVCVTLGWGNVRGEGKPSMSSQLKQLKVRLQRCTINPLKYCVWSTERVKSGLCYGDSGGPLLCSQGGHYFLVGVVSQGAAGCDQRKGKYPATFTNVTHFLPWIYDVIKGSGK